MPENPPKNPPPSTPLLEDKQFLIAIIFIAGFFILMAISLAQYFVSANLEAVKLVGTVFGGWVGAIIGFYFGQKPVEKERERTKDLTDALIKRSDEMWKKIEQKGG